MTHALLSRREWLQRTSAIAGGAVVAHLFPDAMGRAWAQAQTAVDPVAAARAGMAKTPIEVLKLTDTLTLLSGPGGNVVVLNGSEGKIVVDTFIQGVFPALKQRLDAMGNAAIKLAIDTHWHFDHVDNNESFRKAGAGILAHANTPKRMSQPHELLGMKFPASPAGAMPTQTFAMTHSLQANGEKVELAYIPPAHTDTDISVHFTRGNVLHLGDTFFNGMYPVIDPGTGGNLNGMIASADRAIRMATPATKIVPGHGPVADRAALMRYREMLVTVRERLQKLKTAGRSAQEVVAAKPLADLDAVWGKGFLMPDQFVQMAYNSL
ncbi:MAG: MBL fold metallo-hydrolase [Acidimicrobiia bacterium]|nr:MBL fold metallo-hydrolase [Acidimicrobiia bacterium]